MNYGALIGDSLRLMLRNRYLWFFGFFAGGTATNFVFNVPSNFPNVPSDLENLNPGSVALSPALVVQGGPGGGTVALVAALVLLALLLVLLVIALSLLSRAALVDGVAAIEGGGERRFASAWRAGAAGMWRVLGLGVLLFLLGLGLLLAVAAPVGLGIALVFAVTQSVGARVLVTVLLSLVAVALLIAIFVPLAIIGQLALRRMLLGGDGITGCIGGGYGMFRRNVGRSLLLWLIQIVVAFGLGIALLIVAAIVGLLLFLPTIILAVSEITTAAIVAGVIAGVLLLALFVVASGALGTFGSAYWTLAYLRLEAPETRAAEV